MSRLARFTLATVVVTFLLVTVGGLVRATDSGLGCGDDWPHCYGRWIPPVSDFETTLVGDEIPPFLAAIVDARESGEATGLSGHVRDSARSVEILAVDPDGGVHVRVSALETWIEYTHRLLGTLAGIMTIGVLVGSWRRRTGDPRTWRIGRFLLPLIVAQGLLGAYVVGRDLQAWTVVAHLGMAMSYAGVLLAMAVHLVVPPARERVDDRLVRLLAIGAGSVFGLNLLGSWVTGRDAGLAFSDWPLMGGGIWPFSQTGLWPATDTAFVPTLHYAHRGLAVVVGLFLLYVLRTATASGIRRVRTAAHVAAGVFALQVIVGGLNVWTDLHAAAVSVHLSAGVTIWGALVVAWALARRSPAATVTGGDRVLGGTGGRTSVGRFLPIGTGGPRRQRDERSKAAAFLALTKPRIIELLLVTTVPTMVVAQGGWPSTWLVAATVIGGALAAGGANTINMVVDIDIDRLMARTKDRPLVTGEITPTQAMVFAIGLEIAAFAWLWTFANLLSAVLALSATFFYVFVYTLWLKRTSTRNIVIGGAAGCVPVLVGWAAVTGTLGWAPVVLFAIIFYWTPPHFWALAIKYRDDYAAADVPMLPAVSSLAVVARRILGYTILLWALTLVFAPVADMGSIYLASAVVLGAVFTAYAVRLVQTLEPAMGMRLFGWSITYITLLFSAMAVDRLVLA